MWAGVWWVALFTLAPARVSATHANGAEDLVRFGLKQAQAEDKAVFVHFTGARCLGCRELDRLLATEPVSSLMAANYVTVKLTIADPDKAKVTPGAFVLLQSWQPRGCGAPSYVVMSAAGGRVANGCGFPTTAESTDALVLGLSRGAPRMTDTEAKQLGDGVRRSVAATVRGMEGPLSWSYFRSQYTATSMSFAAGCGLASLAIIGLWHRRATRGRRRTTR